MPNPYAPPSAVSASTSVDRAARRDATWALVLGVSSLVLCAPVTAPLAIRKALRAKRAGASARATAAILFAAVGLFTSALFYFLAIYNFLQPADGARHHSTHIARDRDH